MTKVIEKWKVYMTKGESVVNTTKKPHIMMKIDLKITMNRKKLKSQGRGSSQS